MSRKRHSKKRKAPVVEPAGKKTPKAKAWGVGFVPWGALAGMLCGLALGLRSGHSMVPMQIGGIAGAMTGFAMDFIRDKL